MGSERNARDDHRLDQFGGVIPPLLTTRRAVAFTGMSRHVIGRAVKRGELVPAGRKGRTWIFRKVDLEVWLCGGGGSDAGDRAQVVPITAARDRTPLSESLKRIRRAAGRDDA